MSLADRVRALGSPRALVLGDLMLDRYVFGSMGRISPEAPIGILRVSGEESRLGGAAAVARDLAVLGAQVRILGCVGSGGRGKTLRRLAEESGIDASGVVRVYGRGTTFKTRFIARRGAGGQQVLRVDREDASPYPEAEEAALLDGVQGAMGEIDVLVLSDYAKGVLSDRVTREAIRISREAGVPVLADPKPPAYEQYRGATVLTPNRVESAAYAGFPIAVPGDAARAAAKIRGDLELEAVVMKLDQDGLYLLAPDADELLAAVPREVYDGTGAGDMVIAALAMVLASGGTYEEAARIANVAAGVEVGRLGVVPVTREEILEVLHETSPMQNKALGLPELMEILAARRRRGERVVFTNGCFDVLHAGHVRLLSAARAEGDLLVVGLNSDESIRRLKGPGRPVTPEEERGEVLATLQCVDHVVVFREDTPAELIEAVRPDVLVKGEDWRDKGVVGREFVEANGGRVVLIPLTPGLSSTNIIRRMKNEETE